MWERNARRECKTCMHNTEEILIKVRYTRHEHMNIVARIEEEIS